MREIKNSGHFIFLLFLTVLTLPCFQVQELKAESRLFAGFTLDESITSLALNQDWQQKPMARILQPLIYDQLWSMGPAPEYTAVPSLAWKWETEDHRTWTFHLQPEAYFRDSFPVTAEDVIFSLKLMPRIDPALNHREVRIANYKIIDEKTLEVTLAEPHGGNYPPFYRIPVLPSYIWKLYSKKPETYPNIEVIGSGPYHLKDFKAGESLRLVRNTDYWGEGGRFDEVQFLIFNDQKQLHDAMLGGIIDLFGYQGIHPSQIPDFEYRPGINNVISAGMDLNWLSFNLAKSTSLQNIVVRKALMLGISKTEIIDEVYSGYAREIDSFVYPEQMEYNPNTEKYHFDLAKAKALLSKSGFQDFDGDGVRDDPEVSRDLTFTLLISNANQAHVAMGDLIQSQVRALGIRINLMKVDPFIYFSFLHNPVEGGFDIAINSAEPGPYNDWIWNVMKSDEDLYNEYNSSHYINYAFDRVYSRMLTSHNLTRRPKYYYLLQEIMADDLPYGLLVRSYKICPIRETAIPEPISSMGGISSEINVWNYVHQESSLDATTDEPLF